MENVVIYLPNGKELYYFIGAKLENKKTGEKTDLTVTKILEKDNSVLIHFSDKNVVKYSNLPYSTKYKS